MQNKAGRGGPRKILGNYRSLSAQGDPNQRVNIVVAAIILRGDFDFF